MNGAELQLTFVFACTLGALDRSVVMTLGVVPGPAVVRWLELMPAGGSWDIGLGATFSRLPNSGVLVGRAEAEGQQLLTGTTGNLGGGLYQRLRVQLADAASLYPVGARVHWGPWWLRLAAYRDAGGSGLLRGAVYIDVPRVFTGWELMEPRPAQEFSRSMMRGRLHDGRQGGVL